MSKVTTLCAAALLLTAPLFAGCPKNQAADGVSCWDTNNNGSCDTSEDLDLNGTCEAQDCVGATGPQGSPGDPGPQGEQGTPGLDGIDGLPGPSLMKNVTFAFSEIPPVGTSAQLASISFTPPVSGQALLSARGYCNMRPIAGGDNEINIAFGDTLESAFFSSVSEWGVLNVPSGTVNGLYQENWSAEKIIAVSAGITETMLLVGRHETGNASSDCTGSIKVEIFTDTLP